MSDYILRISLPGYDATTATPAQCAVDSRYSIPKISPNTASWTHSSYVSSVTASATGFNYGTITFTFSSTATFAPSSPVTNFNLLTFSHGFSYTPGGILFGNSGLYPQQFADNNSINGWFGNYTDGTNLYFYVQNQLSVMGALTLDYRGLSFFFKYYIFVENGA